MISVGIFQALMGHLMVIIVNLVSADRMRFADVSNFFSVYLSAILSYA